MTDCGLAFLLLRNSKSRCLARSLAETNAYLPEKEWTSQIISTLIKIMSGNMLYENFMPPQRSPPQKHARHPKSRISRCGIFCRYGTQNRFFAAFPVFQILPQTRSGGGFGTGQADYKADLFCPSRKARASANRIFGDDGAGRTKGNRDQKILSPE
jgi:hypothetical protein